MISSCSLVFLSDFSNAADSITQSQSLRDDMTLVSKDGSFELGFFNPGSSKNRYLGIWFKNIPVKTVVWVANRLNPINDSSGVLMVNSSGSLVLLSQNSTTVVWSSNSTKQASNTIVQLLDSGNLVVRDEKEQNPENYLWQSFDYPCDTLLPGMKLGWDLRTGQEWRLSAWKSPEDPSPGELTFGIELNNYPGIVMKKGSEKYFRSSSWNGHGCSGIPELKANRIFNYSFVSNKDEVYYIFHMINESVISYLVLNQTVNLIERESPFCQCLEGFKPKSSETWNPDEWSKGCVRRTQLSCQDKDKIGFKKLVGLKLPDTTNSWLNRSMNLEECKVKCLNDCNCTAYSNSDIRGEGSGCAIWYGDLIDIRQISNGYDANGQDIYIRMHTLDLEKLENNVMIDQNIEGQREDQELPLFNLATIVAATNNFSSNNKLGEGGFGPVYKGTLTDGQEIAVKRLSQGSGQGLNQMRAKALGWSMRFNIIYGIARGLLYLHEDSRLRIIHRDLKASNVLLDSKMSPKISDFGMARICGGDQTEGNTNRVVGTYGYMAPEYAIDGLFSIKSDVFSFGILLLEILGGKKNRGSFHPDHSLNLVGHAWKLWKEGRPLELIDTCLDDSCILSEAVRCLHISFLCLQQHPEDRPNMSYVVTMLHSENSLPEPKEPGFFVGKKSSLLGKNQSSSTNEITVSLLEAR
uniref:non-specific serine/threonine protein kinase n=1 Tax=Fagus sylvatica TaxID=28930 RepID=A0A2N9IZ71_FAGSY